MNEFESEMNDETRQIELQRLVDGQMPEFERVAFLECLDEQPDCWREVALAYVEEQVLQAELSSPASSAEVGRTVADASTATESKPGRIGMLALAAAVILALFAGGAAGRWLTPHNTPLPEVNPNTVVTDNSGVNGNSGTNEMVPVAHDDDYYVLLKPAIDQPQPPEVSPWQYISASMQQPVFGDDTRESIRQHGYEVNEEPVLFVVEDDNGGHYMIPQRHITFVSNKD